MARALPATVALAALTLSRAASADGVEVRAQSEVAAYGDTQHVFVVSPGVTARATSASAGWSVGGSYLADVVSAASVDIVATASRRWEEVRHAATADFAYKPNDFGFAVNASTSSEPDYLALDAGATVTADLLDKTLTLTLGYQHGHDVGGRTGTPFSVFARVLDADSFKAGAALVLDRATTLSVIGDFGAESGDGSKPYRYIPLFAPGTAVPVGASIDVVNRLRLSARALEQLPLSRERYTGSLHLAHRFRASTLRVSERGYVDTWGLKATTTDARYLIDLGKRVEVGPHARVHAQSPVDFWQRAYTLRSGLDFPAIRTGDRELGPLVNLTAGGTCACT